MIKVGDMVVSRGIRGMGYDPEGDIIVGLVLDIYSDNYGSEYYEIQWPHESGWFEPNQLKLVNIIKSDT